MMAAIEPIMTVTNINQRWRVPYLICNAAREPGSCMRGAFFCSVAARAGFTNAGFVL
jgi:hypothetical protein